ncbi:MAG: hypothetical protein HEEMFOPI_01138 [Holosporales bacterium]
MNKILSAAALFAATCGLNAEGLNGFSVGGFVGTEARVKSVAVNNGGSCDKYRIGHLFGLYGRYGRVLSNHLYLGGEFYTFLTTKNGFENLDSLTKLKYKRGYVFGITPVVGHVFGEDSMAYAKLGIESSEDVAEFVTQFSRTYVKKTVLSFAPGFGFEHKFGKHFVAGVDYTYSIGGKLKVLTTTMQRRSHQVMFRFGYMF